MSPLRVLHASPSWFSPGSVVGGGERWVDNVMLALSVGAPWITQAMVSIGKEPSLALRGHALIRVLANERVSQAPMDGVSSHLWREFSNFDVIHVHQSLTDFGAYASCVAASLGKTVVLTDLGGGANPIMLQGGLAIADGIVSISNYAHSMITPGARSSEIVMTGPIDTDAFYPADQPPAELAAICVSRIMPHKGIDRLIRALPPNLKLRIVGRVYHDAYRTLLGELADGKDVEFIHDANDKDLVGLYQRSTLFLQASCSIDVYGNTVGKTELMGLTVLEAMACGLPVIVSSDGGSLSELVLDTKFGRVFTSQSELEHLLHQHQTGRWPEFPSTEKVRSHAVDLYGLSGFGRRLAEFYADTHASRVKGIRCAS